MSTTSTNFPLDQMIPVRARSIRADTRSTTRRRLHTGVNYATSGEWVEIGNASDVVGHMCRFGCKLFARQQGCVIRYAVMHSSIYGHGWEK